jgi:predicted NACHT family NTPase
MLSGSETDIEAKTLEDFVEGKEGTGASTREILYGAAKKGSRIKGYGKVHIDYSMRASRQMEDEKIPPGYREYVEEYFRLIRAR